MRGKLVFKDGAVFDGMPFGAPISIAGEVVFTTGMVGYPESLTDPSYAGQILIFTYPLLGNYGVPRRAAWESGKIHAAGVIVSDYIDTPSHRTSIMGLGEWLRMERTPGLVVKDTRALAQKIRIEGTPLGKIVIGKNVPFSDPNLRNLVDEVSIAAPMGFVPPGRRGVKSKTVALIDCGAKANIRRELLSRGVRVLTVPWNYPILEKKYPFDAIVISNGPGDPTMAAATIATARGALHKQIPIFGICLGNQILALAGGGSTYKLKFGHRGQNQPCRLLGTNRSFLTTQNHGFAVRRIPRGFRPWFVNANDGTNEGLIHEALPFMSVQFHPEAAPGPEDTRWIFDYFLARAFPRRFGGAGRRYE